MIYIWNIICALDILKIISNLIFPVTDKKCDSEEVDRIGCASHGYCLSSVGQLNGAEGKKAFAQF